MLASFSPADRPDHWGALEGGEWDLLVVGGGITGAGAALDAASRGLRVALVEAGDLGRGTSSRSSRLIHGGLRYLETRDFALVFEALAERRRLLSLAPHLVRPLPFLFPVHRGDPVGFRTLQAGMWLYDALSLFRGLPRHRMLDREETLAVEPSLDRRDLRGAALYYDASVDDARLTLAVARGAHRAGAVVLPYAEVVEFIREEGRLRGARVRDALGDRQAQVSARVVLNATGPWSDRVRRLADPDARPRLRATRGVHLVFRRERMGNHGAIIFRSRVDQRVMFILPWGDYTYVGTTDTDYTGDPAEANADAEDVAYLLESANRLFPHARLGAEDVLSAWAGIRPLLAPPENAGGEVAESSTSREHEIWQDPGGLVNIAGGKLTTYRVMAREAVDFVADLLREEGRAAGSPSSTGDLPLPGAPRGPWNRFLRSFSAEAAALGIGAAVADRLARSYGEEARAVLAELSRDPELAEPLMAGHLYLWAEVEHAVRREMALTVEDVLRRRLHLFYEAADGGVGVARKVAEAMARIPGIGWDAEEVARQVERYRWAVAGSRAGIGAP